MFCTLLFLVTMDITSLYTNNDHAQGLEALNHFLGLRPEPKLPPRNFLLALTSWTFNMFQDGFYRQRKGTAMEAA